MSASLPPLLYVDCCVVAATPTIIELTPPGEPLRCHFTSFLLHSLPWQMLDDHLAGGCHCPRCLGTACPPPPVNHSTGRRTVSDSIPTMAPILPPYRRTDSCTTGWVILPGPPWQWNGHHCCRCRPRPLQRLSPTLPIGAAARPQPATPRILPTSMPPHDHCWDNYSPTRERRRWRSLLPLQRSDDDAATAVCP
jgi:hypothetical protein